MSNRIDKVNSLLEREISKILQRDFDFSSDGIVTLIRVDASANLIQAEAYISVMPDSKADRIVGILNKAAFTVQRKVDKILRMRPVPKIIFVVDKTEAKAGRVEQILAELKNKKK